MISYFSFRNLLETMFRNRCIEQFKKRVRKGEFKDIPENELHNYSFSLDGRPTKRDTGMIGHA